MSGLNQSFSRQTPEEDDQQRLVCNHCGFVNYENPKIVVGSVATWEDQILLCKRAIEPRIGYWTLPAGYLEQHESPQCGARREAWEEARAQLEIDQLLATYAITRISQVQLIYRARLQTPEVSAGPESQEVGLFKWEEIPWDKLAFPSVLWSLKHFRDTKHQSVFAPRQQSDAD